MTQVEEEEGKHYDFYEWLESENKRNNSLGQVPTVDKFN